MEVKIEHVHRDNNTFDPPPQNSIMYSPIINGRGFFLYKSKHSSVN